MHLPKALPAKLEASLNVRLEKYKETFDQYVKENCNDKGKQVSNLTPTQQQGVDSLKRRIKAKEILVCPTDKTGKLMLTTPAVYLMMGEQHVSKDEPITTKEVKQTQQILNGHQSYYNKAFNIG